MESPLVDEVVRIQVMRRIPDGVDGMIVFMRTWCRFDK